MDKLFGLTLVVLALYGLIRLLSAVMAGSAGGRYRAYRQLAARYRGQCEARGVVDPPTVTFRGSGATVRVGLAPVVPGHAGPPRTRAVVRYDAGLPLRLELLPLDRPAPAQMPRGTRTVATGRPDFDRVYLVQANDPDIARDLLAPEAARQAIESLRKLCPPAGVLLSINPERLLLQVDRDLGASLPALDAMVQAALLLFERLGASVRAQGGVGIEVVAAGGTDATEGPPVCTVCGEPIEGPHVACETCATPFHKECWGFIGACSTFGCTSKKSVGVGSRE